MSKLSVSNLLRKSNEDRKGITQMFARVNEIPEPRHDKQKQKKEEANFKA